MKNSERKIKEVWRGKRYWTSKPKDGEQTGWNTEFLPYKIMKATEKRVVVRRGSTTVHLDRQKLNTDKKVYHSKFGEYFYITKPAVDPEVEARQSYEEFKRREQRAREQDRQRQQNASRPSPSPITSPLAYLGLTPPVSKDDVARAYKRKALSAHPDTGGSHEEFVRLQSAYQQALRLVK